MKEIINIDYEINDHRALGIWYIDYKLINKAGKVFHRVYDARQIAIAIKKPTYYPPDQTFSIECNKEIVEVGETVFFKINFWNNSGNGKEIIVFSQRSDHDPAELTSFKVEGGSKKEEKIKFKVEGDEYHSQYIWFHFFTTDEKVSFDTPTWLNIPKYNGYYIGSSGKSLYIVERPIGIEFSAHPEELLYTSGKEVKIKVSFSINNYKMERIKNLEGKFQIISPENKILFEKLLKTNLRSGLKNKRTIEMILKNNPSKGKYKYVVIFNYKGSEIKQELGFQIK